MNVVEDFVSIGEPFSKHVRKARGTFNMKRFCDDINWTIDRAEFDVKERLGSWT